MRSEGARTMGNGARRSTDLDLDLEPTAAADHQTDGSPEDVAASSRRRKRRAGMSTYLVSTFGATLVLILLMMTITTMQTSSRQRASAVDQLDATAKAEAQSLASSLQATDGFLRSTVSAADITSLQPERCDRALATLGNELNGQGELAIVDANANVICASDVRTVAKGSLPSVAAAVKSVLASGVDLYDARPDFLKGQPALFITAPVPNPTGRQAALVASLPPTVLIQGPGSTFTKSDVYEVLNKDRTAVITRSPALGTAAGTSVNKAGVGQPLPGGYKTVSDIDGTNRIFRDAPVSTTGWHVLIGTTPGVAFGPAHVTVRRNALLALGMILIVAGLGVFLHRRLARPVRHLRSAIERAGRNDEVRAVLEGPAEVAAVAEAFNATIAERRELERQLGHRALHDPLTELPNRVLLTDRLGQSLSRGRRGGSVTAVFFLDLDRFKLVNDAHGHPVGDQLLVALARRLTSVVRPFDTVARFGGDEFIVLADLDDGNAAADLAERLTGALVAPFDLGGRDIRLSGSIGVAIARGDEEPYEVIRNADVAMYRAKEDNRGGFKIYDDRMHVRALARLETERELYRALNGGELSLYYQPKVSLVTGELLGVEALVRWNHPTRGLVSPAEFIPVAEETGQILVLGEWVMLEACRQSVRWQEVAGEPVQVSVNLSTYQLARDDLPQIVAGVLRETGIEPSALCLEVTEGSLLGDAAAVSARLGTIRELGVRVSIDDFGTGYSSLAYLRTLPIDEIKIDKSFVDDLAKDATARSIVSNIVGLGHALGFSVVAEGIETAGQLDVLRTLGCDVGQGYYLAYPATPSDLPASLFAERHPRVADATRV